MRTVVALVVLGLASALGQTPGGRSPEVEALERRVAALEAEIASLKALLGQRPPGSNEQAKDDDLVASVAKGPVLPTPLPLGRFTDLPYGDDFVFVAADLQSDSVDRPTGGHDVRLTVDLYDVPTTALDRFPKLNLRGQKAIAFPAGLPAGTRRFRMVLEQLTPFEAQNWRELLAPEPTEAAGAKVQAYKFLRFSRVPTSQLEFTGYPGNSGTVHTWRGQLYWYENNVFRLEDGVVRIIGATAARFHVRLVQDDGLVGAR